MRAPGFWWEPGHPAATLLAPLGWLYGAATAWRMDRPGTRPPLPVLCIGNAVAGGAGKTPVALAVAERLRALDRRPVFLTRGYGGRLRGPVLVDPGLHDAAATGDEPQLLAAAAPTVVSRRREDGLALAAQHGDVIVMDDGLQNPAIAKSLSLAVFDGAVGIGNGRCIPAGPLRAPMARQWPHVDAAVILGPGRAGEALAAEAEARGLPALRARLAPDAASGALAGRRVLAFAGIGRPAKFFATLEDLGADVVRRRTFGDHQPYDAATLAGLRADAAREGLALVTTTKDMARLRGAHPPGALAEILVLVVRAVFADEAGLDTVLASALRGA